MTFKSGGVYDKKREARPPLMRLTTLRRISG